MYRWMRALIVLLVCCSPAWPQTQFPFSGVSQSTLLVGSGASPVFWAGTTVGLFRSTDGRATWTPIQLGGFTQKQPGVLQLAFDPSSENIVYARGSGQVWRSDDNGRTFFSKMNGMPAGGSVGRLFVILSQPGTVYAYVYVNPKAYVYKTTDRGDSWSQLVELPFRELGSTAGLFFGAVEVWLLDIHLKNPNLWYLAFERNIFRSENEGQSWARTGPFPVERAGQFSTQNYAAVLRSDPDNQQIVLLGTVGPISGTPPHEVDNGFFFSSNRGETWERKTYVGITNIYIQTGSPAVFVPSGGAGSAIYVSFDRGRNLNGPYDWAYPSSTPGIILPDPNDPMVYHAPGGRSANRGQSWEKVESTAQTFLGLFSDPLELSGSRNSPVPIVAEISAETQSGSWSIPFTIETSGEPWLEVTPASGTTRRALSLKVTPRNLTVGEHSATVRARSAESVNATAELPVALTVTDAPAPSGSPVITKSAGDGGFAGTENGVPALEASLGGVAGMDFHPTTGLVIAENLNDIVRRVDASGVIHIVAGTAQEGFSGDGRPARLAQVNSPRDVAVASDGTIYIADFFNRRLRKVAPDGTISTIAGNGEFGLSEPAQGAAKDLSVTPEALALDGQGNLFVGEVTNTYRINPQGNYVRWSNSGSDGLAVAPDGTVYATRSASHQVFKLGPTSAFPFAGTGERGYSGDGGPAREAQLASPEDVAVDAEGRVYIADSGNNVVRVVETDGTIQTYAGTGVRGHGGDGGPANFAELDEPEALALGPDGTLYVDDGGLRIRKILPPGSTRPELTQAGVVNAASYATGSVAPNQIVAIFGLNLAPETAIATTTPLPTVLAGVTVELTDSAAQTHALPLVFVSAGQINCLIAGEATLGPARLRITSSGASAEVPVAVAAVAPGLFAANANGKDVAAAAAVRVDAGGAQHAIEVVDYSARPFVGKPISLGGESDVVVLLLYGTGFRAHQGAVSAKIGGVEAQVLGIAPQPQYVGLDQMNVIIPKSLAGAGEVEVVVTMGGVRLNVVKVVIE
jgi:uncharacterized protein (TIGR03437 family)